MENNKISFSVLFIIILKIITGTCDQIDFSFLVGLFDHDVGIYCLGSLITQKHILTSGHCFCGAKRILAIQNIKVITNGQCTDNPEPTPDSPLIGCDKADTSLEEGYKYVQKAAILMLKNDLEITENHTPILVSDYSLGPGYSMFLIDIRKNNSSGENITLVEGIIGFPEDCLAANVSNMSFPTPNCIFTSDPVELSLGSPVLTFQKQIYGVVYDKGFDRRSYRFVNFFVPINLFSDLIKRYVPPDDIKESKYDITFPKKFVSTSFERVDGYCFSIPRGYLSTTTSAPQVPFRNQSELIGVLAHIIFKIGNKKICSGAFVTQQYVITPAICVCKDYMKPEMIVVMNADYFLENKFSTSLVSEIHCKHNGSDYCTVFQQATHIAVLKLVEPVSVTKNHYCLPIHMFPDIHHTTHPIFYVTSEGYESNKIISGEILDRKNCRPAVRSVKPYRHKFCAHSHFFIDDYVGVPVISKYGYIRGLIFDRDDNPMVNKYFITDSEDVYYTIESVIGKDYHATTCLKELYPNNY